MIVDDYSHQQSTIMEEIMTISSSYSEFVKKLPREISLYIYTEYLETECKYEIIMREFRSERVQSLHTVELMKIMNEHFHDAPLMSYLRKREKAFDSYYRKIIINNEAGFVLMTKINSLTNCWAFVTYK